MLLQVLRLAHRPLEEGRLSFLPSPSAGDRNEVAKERDLLIAQIEPLNDSTKIQVDALRAALAAERDCDRWHEVATIKPEQTTPVERKPRWRRLAG